MLPMLLGVVKVPARGSAPPFAKVAVLGPSAASPSPRVAVAVVGPSAACAPEAPSLHALSSALSLPTPGASSAAACSSLGHSLGAHGEGGEKGSVEVSDDASGYGCRLASPKDGGSDCGGRMQHGEQAPLGGGSLDWVVATEVPRAPEALTEAEAILGAEACEVHLAREVYKATDAPELPTKLAGTVAASDAASPYAAAPALPARGGAPTARGGSRGGHFWRPAVGRLYGLYIEQRLGLVSHVLGQLDVPHWRQLLDFAFASLHFLAQPPSMEIPAPPVLPIDVLSHILDSYFSGRASPPRGSRCAEPPWYLEAMYLVRLLLQPAAVPTPIAPASAGRGAPPKVVQVLVHLAGSAAAAAFVITAGSTRALRCDSFVGASSDAAVPAADLSAAALEAAWLRHGGDVLLACQHILVRLYPDSLRVLHSNGPRESLAPESVPSVVGVAAAAACHFTAQLLTQPLVVPGASSIALASGLASAQAAQAINLAQSPEQSPPQSPRQGAAPPRTPARASHQFSAILHSMGLFELPPCASQGTVDRFLVCVREVLQRLLGPGPAAPDDLPKPVAPIGGVDEADAVTPPDIQLLAKIARNLIQAYFTDSVLLVAWEDHQSNVRSGPNGATETAEEEEGDDGLLHSATVSPATVSLVAGVFAGPSEPGDFVPVQGGGPLRRGLAFMQQSPLLCVVQRKLCAARFDDVSATSTPSSWPLESYAIRNIRVLWFDLRRCTSTFKRDAQPAESGAGGLDGVLVLRHLRFCLAHDWEARLATFPYLHVGSSSQVTVRSLAITVKLSLRHGEGLSFREVSVVLPDLEVKLDSAGTQVLLGAMLTLFQASLQDHIQKQVRRIMLQVLQQEAAKWNGSIWHNLMTVAPEHLVSDALAWISAHIPPEGIPI